MVDPDDRLLRDLARLRDRSGPPVGAEQRVRAALDAAIGPGPGGGDDGGSALGGHAGAELGGAGKSSLVTKLLVATAAAAGVGLLVELGVKRDRPAPEAEAPPISAVETNRAQAPPSTAQPQPEPPILVTPRTQPPGPAPRPSEPDEDLLTAEVVLLDRARTTDDLAARLELLEQHRTRFQHGHLAAERESLRISTLCELDQLDRARAAAEEFLLAHPRSPLRLRMRSACPKLDILAE